MVANPLIGPEPIKDNTKDVIGERLELELAAASLGAGTSFVFNQGLTGLDVTLKSNNALDVLGSSTVTAHAVGVSINMKDLNRLRLI